MSKNDNKKASHQMKAVTPTKINKEDRQRLADGLSLFEAFYYPGARFIYRTAWDGSGKSVRVGRELSHLSMITIEDAWAKDWWVES